jgi:ubiquinone/menaquinone biosynthesis C-methylase UbiE
MAGLPPAAGKSSFDLIDRKKLFSLIDMPYKSIVVDLACGIGRYSIELSNYTEARYEFYAIDLWSEGIDVLKGLIADQHINNIHAIVADISKKIPLEHDLSKEAQDSTLREVHRVLKPEGVLMIIEFKIIDYGPGPPVDIRLSEHEVEHLASIHEFKKISCDEIGEFNYLMRLQKNA